MTVVTRRTVLISGAIAVAAVAATQGCTAAARMRENTPMGGVGFTLAYPVGDGADFLKDLERVRVLGASWVRFGIDFDDAVSGWNFRGKLIWDEVRLASYDVMFDAIEDAGFSVCFLTVNGVTGVGESEYLAIMVEYWSGLAERFGARIDVWQIFNEADGRDFFDHSAIPEATFDVYLDRMSTALGAARTAILERAPRVKLTTNASGFPFDQGIEAEWIRYFDGIADHLDILSVDPYPQFHTEAIDSLPAALRAVSEKFGKPITVAEFGLQTGDGLYSEDQQIRALTMTLEALAGSVAEHSIVYRLRDDGAFQDDGFGLYTITGTPKASVAPVTEAIARFYPEG